MPLNEVPKYLTPEIRSLIEAALEDAWQELNKDGKLEAAPARNKLRTHGGSRLGWRNRSSKAQVVRHSCLARSTTSAAIVVSTARPDERNGGLDFRHLVKLSRQIVHRWDTRARKHNDHMGRLIVPLFAKSLT